MKGGRLSPPTPLATGLMYGMYGLRGIHSRVHEEIVGAVWEQVGDVAHWLVAATGRSIEEEK